MAQSKKLTLGNHIYLYQVLCSQIPCGRQTFIPQVESVLEAADLAATDLGFESTRELLEELDDFIKLTVFKGGRIYATVIAQPAWDEALAATAKKADAPQGKSWKKKRGDRSLKAVRPRHAPKASEPVVEPEPEADPEPVLEAENATEVASIAEIEVVAETTATVEGEPQADEPEASDADTSQETKAAAADDTAEGTAVEDEPEVATEPQPQPEAPRPAVSLKVLYDPDNANAGVTTLESTPYEQPAPAEGISVALPIERLGEQDAEPAEPSASTAPSAPAEATPVTTAQVTSVAPTQSAATPAQVPAPAEPAPKPEFSFEGYPTDFHTEVFCPGPQLSELSSLLPWGADALGIAGEYYWIARESGTIEATRSRAVFPLRYTQDGGRHEVRIEMRRRNGAGASWAIEAVRAEDEPDGGARA